MAFPNEVKIKALVACVRRCCICHKFCGNNMEIHHIRHHAKGGDDTFENAIPLCFDCHAEVGQYDPTHPKGTKKKKKELISHRDNWYKKVKEESVSEKKEKFLESMRSIRVYITKDSEPQSLINVSTGKELFSYAENTCAIDFDYDEPDNEEVLDVLLHFSDELESVLDDYPYMGLAQKMSFAFQFTTYIKQLEEMQYMVFTERANRIIKGGALPADNFPVWIVRIFKNDNPQIVTRSIENNETSIQTSKIPG